MITLSTGKVKVLEGRFQRNKENELITTVTFELLCFFKNKGSNTSLNEHFTYLV